MALRSFGKIAVPTSGTPVQIKTTHQGLQSIMVQAYYGNTGRIFVGLSTMVISTGVGVLAVLPAPSSATTGPFASVTFTEALAPAGFNLADLYLDCSANGDSAYVSGTEQ